MNFKNIVLGLGIFVVYALALWQGLQTFYPEPMYEDYCTINRAQPFPTGGGAANCSYSAELNNQANACYASKGEFVYTYDQFGCPLGGYCDECRIGYEEALDDYSNKIFVICLILGIIVLAAGLFLLSTEPVGSALMAGGIWTVFFGVVKNWRNFTDAWRFLLLFVLLVLTFEPSPVF